MDTSQFKRVKVLVETDERTLRGYIYQPLSLGDIRLSDFLNQYQDKFLRLTEVDVLERGHLYRVTDHQDFMVVSMGAITYIAPLEGE